MFCIDYSSDSLTNLPISLSICECFNDLYTIWYTFQIFVLLFYCHVTLARSIYLLGQGLKVILLSELYLTSCRQGPHLFTVYTVHLAFILLLLFCNLYQRYADGYIFWKLLNLYTSNHPDQ